MKTAILLLAWGAGTLKARTGLACFEELCRARFPRNIVRWAYTSELSRARLQSQRCKSDSVAKALFRLHYEKYRRIVIQPLQIIPGREYGQVIKTVSDFQAKTSAACSLGEPLLGKREKLDAVAQGMLDHIPPDRAPAEDVIFMGHGSSDEGSNWYGILGGAIQKRDPHVFIGTMAAPGGLAALQARLSSRRVWLLPFFATVGKHAAQDMAGANEDSWKSRLEKAGHVCAPVLKSLCESLPLANLWLDNLGEAMNRLPPGNDGQIEATDDLIAGC